MESFWKIILDWPATSPPCHVLVKRRIWFISCKISDEDRGVSLKWVDTLVYICLLQIRCNSAILVTHMKLLVIKQKVSHISSDHAHSRSRSKYSKKLYFFLSLSFCLKIHDKLPPKFENYTFNTYLVLCFVVDCWKKSTDFGDYFWQVECFSEGPERVNIDRMGKTGA